MLKKKNAEMMQQLMNSAEYDDTLEIDENEDQCLNSVIDQDGEMSSATQVIPDSADLSMQRNTRGTIKNPRPDYRQVYWDQYRQGMDFFNFMDIQREKDRKKAEEERLKAERKAQLEAERRADPIKQAKQVKKVFKAGVFRVIDMVKNKDKLNEFN